MSVDNESTISVNRVRRALSQNEPALLRHMKSQQSQKRMKSTAHLVSGLRVDSLLRTWDNVSKINFLTMAQLEHDPSTLSVQMVHRRSTATNVIEEHSNEMRVSSSEEDLIDEEFPINVTPIMNDDQLWGCFYPFPELYADAYSPVVRMRTLKDVPPIVGGVLTRDMVSACLTYLKRNPILGDFVYIKLDLSNKHLVNIEVLQFYKYLVYLDLSSNYLTELKVLSHLLYLQYLNVAFNRLNTVLEYDVPQWFLTEVHYKFNSVKRIRDLSLFWSITVLDLSHNNIKCISGLDFLQYLRRLDLSFNHIQRLENLNNLRLIWLDVSYNNISTFEFGPQAGLWTLLHLEYLNLNENNLTSMKIFSECTRLQELHARNNRLGMLLELAVYMRQMRRLAVLDLRANPICSIPGYKEVVVSTFPKLLSLDAQDLDPVTLATLKMEIAPDVHAFACRRLLRLLYIEQLSRARISPFLPPADSTDVPMVIFVGYEAVGKGSLARRLASECSSNVELALQHTTAIYHQSGHYKEITRHKFDDMLLAGEFLTYNEAGGESYGLSREEAYVKDGKLKIATMDLTSALMLKLRGYRPYIILTTWMDQAVLAKRQQERKFNQKITLGKGSSLEVPLASTLQVLISGRILITGILNEILLSLPEEKEQSEFVIESECSLLMDSEARKAIQDYAKGVNLLTLLSGASSIDAACNRVYNKGVTHETSLYSLYKESQTTDEYASDIGQNSYQDSKKSKPSQIYENSGPKSVDFTKYISSTWKGIPGMNSSKSSKSVTFTYQDGVPDQQAVMAYKDDIQQDVTGLMIDPLPSEDRDQANQKQPRSLSKKFPWPTTTQTHGQPGPSSSIASIDDADLWLTFLIETGLLGAASSCNDAEPIDRHESCKVDDPELIMKQLAYYRLIPCQALLTNIRNDYEDVHQKCPGVFWDTITMDNPEEAFKKAKRILKDIFQSQKDLKPMFDIDFHNMTDCYPTVQARINSILDFIAPQKLDFS